MHDHSTTCSADAPRIDEAQLQMPTTPALWLRGTCNSRLWRDPGGSSRTALLPSAGPTLLASWPGAPMHQRGCEWRAAGQPRSSFFQLALGQQGLQAVLSHRHALLQRERCQRRRRHHCRYNRHARRGPRQWPPHLPRAFSCRQNLAAPIQSVHLSPGPGPGPGLGPCRRDRPRGPVPCSAS